MYVELNKRILFFDGGSAWEGDALLDRLLTYGQEPFSHCIDKVPNTTIKQKTECDPLPEIKWTIPEEYLSRDIQSELLEKAKLISLEAEVRVKMELEKYEKRNMIPLLQTLLYVRDKFIENDITWGVGRGSSVSSYVLFLMRIHLVDSLKYDLSIEEFLR